MNKKIDLNATITLHNWNDIKDSCSFCIFQARITYCRLGSNQGLVSDYFRVLLRRMLTDGTGGGTSAESYVSLTASRRPRWSLEIMMMLIVYLECLPLCGIRLWTVWRRWWCGLLTRRALPYNQGICCTTFYYTRV